VGVAEGFRGRQLSADPLGGGTMRLLTLALLALAMSGCPFGGVNQINRIPESQPLREPELFNRPGILQHDPSGFAFPEWYGNFQRVTAYRYDTAGLDVSIGYNDRSLACLIVATFYVYPAPRMSFIGAAPSVVASLQERWLRDEFARSRAEIEAVHPSLREPSVLPSVISVSDSLVQGPSLTFAESDQLSEFRLFLYNRQWFLKYRFTYPESCKSEAVTRIAALTRQLPWAAAQQGAAAAEPQRGSIDLWHRLAFHLGASAGRGGAVARS
jgi:hypothetical protein